MSFIIARWWQRLHRTINHVKLFIGKLVRLTSGFINTELIAIIGLGCSLLINVRLPAQALHATVKMLTKKRLQILSCIRACSCTVSHMKQFAPSISQQYVNCKTSAGVSCKAAFQLFLIPPTQFALKQTRALRCIWLEFQFNWKLELN